MAALRSLSLSHLRSHKATHIEVAAGPVAIFGPNGAGKTNILEAISLLSPGRGLRRASAEDLARAPEAIGWKLRARIEADTDHEIETWAEPGTSRQLRIDGKAAAQTTLASLLRILWLVPSMDRLWSDGASERRRFLDRVAMSFFPAHAEASIAYERAMRDRNRLLKDDVRDTGWFDALERQMAEHGAAIITHRLAAIDRLTEAQAAAETSFPRADLALVSGDALPPEQDAQSLMQALSDGRGRDRQAGRSLTGPHRADLHASFAAKGVEAKLCSTGEQKALLISLVLANARALAQDLGTPPILLLDEVAAHLDQDRRMRLYDEITSLGAQAWMTGTGADLFETLDSATRLEVSEADGASHLRILQ